MINENLSKKIVSSSIAAVFNEVNHSVEAKYERILLSTVSKNKYVEFILRTVGVFPLFGTNLHASIDKSFVKIGISYELESERYKDKDLIKRGLIEQKYGKQFDSRVNESKNLKDAILKSNGGVALLGAAGSGKTTVLRHL